MATIKKVNNIVPTSIDNFLGLNMNKSGDTQLQLGESGKMKNFRITADYKLEKINGYDKLTELVANKKVRYVGKHVINNTTYLIAVCNGKVYKIENTTATELGIITDDVICVFEFNNKIYFINGHEYKSYDGDNFIDVAGYIPLVMISSNPEGVGTEFESINLLTGKKKQSFSTVAGTTTYTLLETAIDSIDSVMLNGNLLVLNTNYTVNLTNGTITLSTSPSEGTDNLIISWTKGTGSRSYVYNNRYGKLYGVSNDTRILLWGNSEAKNRFIWSGLADGIPSVEYFPANNFNDIGSNNEPITDINRQYDRLIISTNKKTYYAVYEAITDTTGAIITTFSTYPLNDAYGMIAEGQGQVINNNVITIDSSLIEWINTETKDERNAQIISQKIQEWINDKDMTKAITMDYQYLKEYWVAINNEVMIYNYGNGTFYLLDLPISISYLWTDDDDIYIGANNGCVYKNNKEATTFDGIDIKSYWESGFYDFKAEYLRKTMRVVWLTLKPFTKTSVDISYVTDRDSSSETKTISTNSISFGYMDFADFSFNTNRLVKPFRVKIKAKKFTFLKIILQNNKTQDKLLIDNISIKYAFGSESK